MVQNTHDINIQRIEPITSPRDLLDALPLTSNVAETVVKGREQIQRVLAGEDSRVLVIVGPCSIHDETAALEYGKRLAELASRVSDRILLVMRVYFEKPRTTVGWKGLINDPKLDGSLEVVEGLHRARKLLLDLGELGLLSGTEFLDPIVPQYLADVVSWAAIGARTTESQTHREMASGLSMPVGFKNGTDGNSQIAVDAMKTARAPHAFLGIDLMGRTCQVKTRGNGYGHLILRGGSRGTNYEETTVRAVQAQLEKAGLPPRVMVDCSHANSEKDHARQPIAFRDVIEQRRAGNRNLVGLMVESNLHEGRQNLGEDPSKLDYGVSITDACMGWEDTESLILEAHSSLAGEPVSRAS